MFKRILISTILLSLTTTFATAQWYEGKINRIWPHEQQGGFVVTFEADSSLSDCKYNYAYFRAEDIQSAKLKAITSIALSAFHSGSTVGVIIDKGDAEDYCFATDMDIRK